MRFALCNEMFEKRPLAEVCAITRRLGYHGLEIAPFTLAVSAGEVTAAQRAETRRVIADHGLETVGLHWLLVGPSGLHMTSPDDAVFGRTRDYLRALIDLCGDLGGKVLVIGSPKQRSVPAGQTRDGAWARARDLFQCICEHAQERGATLCLEPLSLAETDFINSVAEAMRMVREIGHPNFTVHLDVKAMCGEPAAAGTAAGTGASVAGIIRSVRAADVGHVHVNDSSLYGPGMGDVDYGPIAAALRDIGWDKWLSVEVFKYDPDPETIARKSVEYLRTFWPS